MIAEKTATSKKTSAKKSQKQSLLKSFTKDDLAKVYRLMVTARQIDAKLLTMLKQGKASFHIGVSGHEAAQIAVGQTMRSGADWSYPYYRNLAYCLSLGFRIEDAMLDFLFREEAPSTAGRQMYAHWGHKELRIVSQSSPTGTQFLQAVGTAIGCKREKKGEIVYVSAGEGTTSQGDFHEALNWAAREKLPIVFMIENNGYAISVPIREQTAGQSVYKLAAGYEGLIRYDVDGTDYFEMKRVANEAVAKARNGEGAVLINANVVRLLPHSSSDDHSKYRTEEELAEDRKRDCILRFEQRVLSEQIFSQEELDAIKADAKQKIDDAATWAESRPVPKVETVMQHVYSDAPLALNYEATVPSGAPIVMVDAINHALDEELAANPNMLIYGEDVAGGKGGVFTATRNLTAKHGADRVFNSPLAESSIVGTAIGLAIMGFKPVVEIQFGDYIFPAMMQIRNELAMMRYRSNGKWKCPVVIRVPVGGYIHGAHYHSQNIEAFFAHIPGLVVVYPSNATDAKGLLKTACRADDPVLFLEHKYLYRQGFAKTPEPDENYFTPFGKARVVREGRDISVITYGALVQRALEAARKLEQEGVSVEVVDLRSILPYDKEAILKSVKKTSKVLVAHEDMLTQGFGAEIAAFIAEQCFEYLDAPVKRLGALDVAAVPYADDLEDAVLPNDKKMYDALKELAKY
ncbi:MAG: dehydrogenase E1 component subunit alpha/beta [Chloroherpetonaceae bacterium]